MASQAGQQRAPELGSPVVAHAHVALPSISGADFHSSVASAVAVATKPSKFVFPTAQEPTAVKQPAHTAADEINHIARSPFPAPAATTPQAAPPRRAPAGAAGCTGEGRGAKGRAVAAPADPIQKELLEALRTFEEQRERPERRQFRE